MLRLIIDRARRGQAEATAGTARLGPVTVASRWPRSGRAGFIFGIDAARPGILVTSCGAMARCGPARATLILWDAPAIAAGLASAARRGEPDGRRPRPAPAQGPAGGDPGNRNDTLNRGVFLATRNGEPVEPHIEAAREAGLPDREIAATVASATKGAERDLGTRTLVFLTHGPPGGLGSFALSNWASVCGFNIRARRYEYRICRQMGRRRR